LIKKFPYIYILCGGKGLRAREIDKTKPKILIEIKNKPFLYWALKNLEKKGAKNVVLCTGYKSKQIEKYIKLNKNKFKLKIHLSKEKKKLGTGGAIKFAIKNYKRDFFVMYGDTFLFYDLNKIMNFSKNNNNKSVISIYKNNDVNYRNNIFLKKNIFKYDKANNKNFNYIDYGLIYFTKKNFNYNKSKFDITNLIESLIFKKKLIPFKVKKKFLEMGSIYGYKKLIKNFELINNELY